MTLKTRLLIVVLFLVAAITLAVPASAVSSGSCRGWSVMRGGHITIGYAAPRRCRR